MGDGVRARDRRGGRAWVLPSLTLGLAAAVAVAAAVLVARLISLDAAVVVAPAAVVFVVAMYQGRATALRRRQVAVLRRRMRQRVDAHDRRQVRVIKAEVSRLYAQLESLAAVRDTIDGRVSLPGTRDWAASADILRELIGLVMSRHPRAVVETGSGTSTVVVAACLRRLGAGHVWALEHLPRFAAETRSLLAERGLEDWATVVDAPLVDLRLGDGTWSWYDLAGLATDAPIDILFVDGPPGPTGDLARYPALPMLRDRLAPGAAILVDDGARPDERTMIERWRTEVPGLESRRLQLEKGGALLILPDPTRDTTG